MLRLYGSAKSRALRNLWLLGELGVPYDHKDYLPGSRETRTPEFRALDPNSRIPVIDDDGFVLSESMAINLDLSKWAHLQTWLTQCWARPAAKRVRAMRE